jgi:hypothetical protein
LCQVCLAKSRSAINEQRVECISSRII